MKYLALLLMVMFFTNNAAAAIRAICVGDPSGQGGIAVHLADTDSDKHEVSESDVAGPCLKHCVQSQHYYDQQTWTDVSSPARLPAPKVILQLSHPALPRLVLLAFAPPFVGPRLTILYRNFRN